ncbi:MAG: enoyl-ACP reductase FabI [Oceanococcus sp.]
MGFLSGKRALITGVASDRSIASGIAKAMHREGAELAFTYQGEKLLSRVEACAEKTNSSGIFECDVASDESISNLASAVEGIWPDGFDIVVHSIGFAPREQLQGSYLDAVTREGYQISHDISAYSFPGLAKAFRSQLRTGGSLITMTYLGAVRAVPMYNVMGPAKASLEANVRFMAAELGERNIRVNGISAGPIKTLAAAGIKGFRGMLSSAEAASPLRRNVTPEEVGNAAAFLCSDLASGITGEILYVDAGYNIQGMAGVGD